MSRLREYATLDEVVSEVIAPFYGFVAELLDCWAIALDVCDVLPNGRLVVARGLI